MRLVLTVSILFLCAPVFAEDPDAAEGDCVICLQPLGETLRGVLPCTHNAFHADCLAQMVATGLPHCQLCPICRSPINPQAVPARRPVVQMAEPPADLANHVQPDYEVFAYTQPLFRTIARSRNPVSLLLAPLFVIPALPIALQVDFLRANVHLCHLALQRWRRI